MKKRILAILLTLWMAIQLVPMAFAADSEIPADEIVVGATLQVRKGGSDANWNSSDASLTMTASDMQSTVDFRVELDIADLRNALIDWYVYGIGLIDDIANGNEMHAQVMKESFDAQTVEGALTIVVTYPEQFTIPQAYSGGNLYGFTGADVLFEETERKIGNGTCEISIQLKDGIQVGELYRNVQEGKAGWLDEMVLVVTDVETGSFTGTTTVEGVLSGSISLGGEGSQGAGQQAISVTASTTATLTKKATVTPSVSKEYKITFNVDGNTDDVAALYENGTVKDLPVPTKDGYTFDGWYTDSAMTQKVDGSIRVSKDMTLYGHWISKTLETEQHYAYVVGYPDETIRPDNNIAREEVAMIFYRLLKDDMRATILTQSNAFKDVASERWSNTAISTMVNGNYIVGREDGTFDPAANITRAEFATMATRFANLTETSDAAYSDIEGHWAETYIRKAIAAGWIAGYPDGTFKPDAPITRAEAMTLINRVLSRSVNAAGLHQDAKVWSDIKAGDWFYHIVIEATNSHTYIRQEDGLHENWSAIIENKIWN